MPQVINAIFNNSSQAQPQIHEGGGTQLRFILHQNCRVSSGQIFNENAGAARDPFIVLSLWEPSNVIQPNC